MGINMWGTHYCNELLIDKYKAEKYLFQALQNFQNHKERNKQVQAVTSVVGLHP